MTLSARPENQGKAGRTAPQLSTWSPGEARFWLYNARLNLPSWINRFGTGLTNEVRFQRQVRNKRRQPLREMTEPTSKEEKVWTEEETSHLHQALKIAAASLI
ncbi:hypothetical protein LY76DRAFT_670918 [Colletotrichum caudatum]|nr:hypothetical protein LY76DRAFT_670918 [Colletotrichum caudatum]